MAKYTCILLLWMISTVTAFASQPAADSIPGAIIPDARRKLKAAKAGYTNEAYKRAEESLKDLERHLKRQNKASYSITELTSHVNEGIKGALRTPASGL